MKKILIPIGCRSDEGLSLPVIKRLRETGMFEVKTCQLDPNNFVYSYQLVDFFCAGNDTVEVKTRGKPDLVMIFGDRVEMTAAACAAFHNKVPICHVYAGVINNPITTFDDIDRHCISLWADIHLCENDEATWRVESVCNGIKACYPEVVGITHLDDMEIDEGKVPWEKENDLDDFIQTKEYDLILYNTPTMRGRNTEIKDIASWINTEKHTILIGGNPDGDDEGQLIGIVDEYYPSLPRAQFLGLLKNCDRFITNSSSALYEAPYFLKPEQIIMVGERNRNRPKVDCVPGGSDKIVEAVKRHFFGEMYGIQKDGLDIG